MKNKRAGSKSPLCFFTGEKRGTSADITFSPLMFIILNIIFAGMFMFFISASSTGATVYEQMYAKQVALVIDEAKPEMEVKIDFTDGIKVAAKNKKTKDLIRIDKTQNLVTVDLGSGGYSYKYFSGQDVAVNESIKDKTIVIKVGNKVFGVEPPVSEGTASGNAGSFDFSRSVSYEELEKAMNYAKENTVEGRVCFCGSGCGNYVNWILEYSKEYSVNPLLVLSVMMQESSCKKGEISFDGSSYGLMQVNTVFKRADTGKNAGHCGDYGLSANVEDCRRQLIDPETNIRVGVEILKEGYGENPTVFACKNIFYSGWERALRNYVGWGCDEIHKDYVETVGNRYTSLGGVAYA